MQVAQEQANELENRCMFAMSNVESAFSQCDEDPYEVMGDVHYTCLADLLGDDLMVSQDEVSPQLWDTYLHFADLDQDNELTHHELETLNHQLYLDWQEHCHSDNAVDWDALLGSSHDEVKIEAQEQVLEESVSGSCADLMDAVRHAINECEEAELLLMSARDTCYQEFKDSEGLVWADAVGQELWAEHLHAIDLDDNGYYDSEESEHFFGVMGGFWHHKCFGNEMPEASGEDMSGEEESVEENDEVNEVTEEPAEEIDTEEPIEEAETAEEAVEEAPIEETEAPVDEAEIEESAEEDEVEVESVEQDETDEPVEDAEIEEESPEEFVEQADEIESEEPFEDSEEPTEESETAEVE